MRWDTPAKKTRALEARRQRGYRAQPLRRLSLPKMSGTHRWRPLSIPTMPDRALQALSRLARDAIAATWGEPHAYGGRRECAPADAREPCGKGCARPHAPQGIVQGERRACFDRLSHDGFVAPIPMERAILPQWRKAGCMDPQSLSRTATGVPPGGIASPAIANLTLDGLERVVKASTASPTRRAQRATVHRVSLADEGIMTGSSYALLAQESTPWGEQFLRERERELSAENTPMTPLEDGVDFLGQPVRKDAGTLFIKPAQKHVKAGLGHIRTIVPANKQATTAHLIAQLNPVSRGWAHSHRHVASNVTFYDVDTAIGTRLWSWAQRRQPTKATGWVAPQYFRPRHGRHGMVFGQPAGHELERVRAGDVPMQRHGQSRGAAHPYDPQGEVSFEERWRVKMAHDRKGRRQLWSLWKHQDGLCPLCHQKMTRRTGWHNHHTIWRTYGGSDTADNRVLLPPNCHRQVHSQSFDVAQLRSTRSV